MPRIAALCLTLIALSACTAAPRRADVPALQAQVAAAERAFADTMARRDHAAFGEFVAADAVFFNGAQALRGRDAVMSAWKAYFDGAQAPFSWEPDQVEALDSGTLALSTGPVRDAQGKIIARFNSIWRLEPNGQWRVVFDRGSPVCAPPTKE